jgi:putative permease
MSSILTKWFKQYLSRPEAIALVLIFIAALATLNVMGQILVPIIISVFLAYLLFGMVKILKKNGLPAWVAVILVYSLFISLFLLACLWLFPVLWEELVALVSEVPSLLSNGQILLFRLHDAYPELVSISHLHRAIALISQYLANFGKEAVAFSIVSLFNMVTVIIYLVLIPLLVFFFLRDGEKIIKWFTNFLPKDRRILQHVWEELQEQIRNYIRGKTIEIVIVGAVSIAVFGILGLRYAILLGSLVGLAVVIPYIGFIVVTVPIAVIGLMQWGVSAQFFYLMSNHIIISILDAYILVPFLFSEVMNLHPLAIILAVLIFGNLFGFWGVFFAIPLMTLVNVLIKSWPREEIEVGEK